MKLENDRFYIVKKTKLFIINLEKIVSSFPNRDHVGKNRIIDDAFSLLENIYLANSLKQGDEKFSYYGQIITTKINMLDFYLERAYKLKYISENQCLNLSNSLLEINRMVITWILNNRNNKDDKDK